MKAVLLHFLCKYKNIFQVWSLFVNIIKRANVRVTFASRMCQHAPPSYVEVWETILTLTAVIQYVFKWLRRVWKAVKSSIPKKLSQLWKTQQHSPELRIVFWDNSCLTGYSQKNNHALSFTFQKKNISGCQSN